MAKAAFTRLPGIAAIVATVLGLSGCSDLLEVSRPGSLKEEQLDDPALEQFIINGVIGEFQYAYANYAVLSSTLADEAFTDHLASVSHNAVSLHRFDDLNGVNNFVYVTLQSARQSADNAADGLKRMLGVGAASNLNVARALIYGGYSYVLLAEGFCEAPVNLSAGLPPAELFTRAIARFDEGIAVATAARTGPDPTAAIDLLQLAQVGAARASLKKGDPVKARTYAAPVSDTYARWAYYSANSTRENNPVQVPTRTQQPFLGMHPAFQGLTDVRVPQPTTTRQSFKGNPIFPPLKPSMYSGWTSNGPPQPVEIATHIRFASGLEARYIGIEADGQNAAMLAFVNARRAVAGKSPVSLSGSLLLAEFRAQRAIDFYLTGQRLGDLRRYAAAGTNLFPTGKFPVGAETYGNMHCFIVPQTEKSGNPNY